MFASIAVAGAVVLGLAGFSVALTPRTVGDPIAPDPRGHPDPVIRIYGADVWGLRGRFAIHTWIALKPFGAEAYKIYQVIGWRLRRGQPALSISEGDPNKPWFGSPPMLLHEVRGDTAQALMTRVEQAIHAYPHADEYTMFPGPNSNSFTAWVALEVPELGLQLPTKAIGKNWMAANYLNKLTNHMTSMTRHDG